MTIQVIHGDCLEAMRGLPPASVDSVVTDPPAGISFMNRDWDHHKGGRDQWIVWMQGVAAECLRVCKPGSHALVWALPRTSHWTATAWENAGWEVRDRVSHLFGSGFPKSLDVGKAIDKRGGNVGMTAEIGAALKAAREARGMTAGECDRVFCDGSTNWSWFEGRKNGQRAPTAETFAAIAVAWPEIAYLAEVVAEAEREVLGENPTYRRMQAEASAYNLQRNPNLTAPATNLAKQWDGWGTALKPAMEDWWLLRKPLIGTVAANVAAHGTGAINIAACRVATNGERNPSIDRREAARRSGNAPGRPGEYGHTVQDRTTAETYTADHPGEALGRWPASVCHDGSDEVLEAFARFGERRASCHTSPSVTDAGHSVAMGYKPARAIPGENVYADAGTAARFFFSAKSSREERGGSKHPTIKPLSLMQWLCRLITPPGGTILDPFAGSGTTGVAADREGFNAILVEREAEYVADIRRRVSGDAPLLTEVA